MALVNCPDCGKDVSDQAKNCPNCGHPFNDVKETLKKESQNNGSKKKIIQFGIIAIIIVAVIVGVNF